MDIIKSTEAYKTGHLKQALKDAFMECDHQLLTKDAIEEMKRMIQQDLPEEDSGYVCLSVCVCVCVCVC